MDKSISVLVRGSEQYGCKRIRASIVEIVHRDDGETDVRGSGHEFAQLVAECRLGGFRDELPRETWGFEIVHNDLHLPTLRDAEECVDRLRRVNRAMSKMAEREGNPESFGQFVNRFARAVKVDSICQQRVDRSIGGSMGVADAGFVVESIIRAMVPDNAEVAA